jgi:DNA replication protein DnaC
VARAGEEGVKRACPLAICDGSGWILGPEDVARACECREQRLARGRTRGVSSVIPARYRGVSFERPPVSDMARDLQNRMAVDAVRDYVGDLDAKLAAGRGLWLVGNTGTGKTTLAMLAAKMATEAGRSVAIYPMPKLLARIKRTYYAEVGEDSYLPFFERLTSVDLLLLDDLGAERRTDWVVEQLYAIVNERYDMRRSLLLTSNAAGGSVDENIKALKEQLGERAVSRLVETCDVVPLYGDDMRYRPESLEQASAPPG